MTQRTHANAPSAAPDRAGSSARRRQSTARWRCSRRWPGCPSVAGVRSEDMGKCRSCEERAPLRDTLAGHRARHRPPSGTETRRSCPCSPRATQSQLQRRVSRQGASGVTALRAARTRVECAEARAALAASQQQRRPLRPGATRQRKRAVTRRSSICAEHARRRALLSTQRWKAAAVQPSRAASYDSTTRWPSRIVPSKMVAAPGGSGESPEGAAASPLRCSASFVPPNRPPKSARGGAAQRRRALRRGRRSALTPGAAARLCMRARDAKQRGAALWEGDARGCADVASRFE